MGHMWVISIGHRVVQWQFNLRNRWIGVLIWAWIFLLRYLVWAIRFMFFNFLVLIFARIDWNLSRVMRSSRILQNLPQNSNLHSRWEKCTSLCLLHIKQFPNMQQGEWKGIAFYTHHKDLTSWNTRSNWKKCLLKQKRVVPLDLHQFSNTIPARKHGVP